VIRRLEENIALNDLTDQIEIIEAAASSSSGRAVFNYNPRVPLTSGGSIQGATCATPSKEEVQTITIDELMLKPDLIKIDVENHEAQVLEGACQTIQIHRPRLILEANNERYQSGILDMLRRLRYTWRLADERNILASPA
jgi:FkbM family methyltransferase